MSPTLLILILYIIYQYQYILIEAKEDFLRTTFSNATIYGRTFLAQNRVQGVDAKKEIKWIVGAIDEPAE